MFGLSWQIDQVQALKLEELLKLLKLELLLKVSVSKLEGNIYCVLNASTSVQNVACMW